MSTTAEQQLWINNYKKLVDDTYNKKVSSTTLENLFINANHVQLPNYDCGENKIVYLHLGYNGKALCGIISNTKTGASSNSVSGIFTKSDLKIDPAVKDDYTPKEGDNRISKDAYNARKDAWAKGNKAWVQKAINEKNVVEYFNIDKQNISKSIKNDCVLGLTPITDTETKIRIDLMTVNEAYMDYTTPTPPFRL